MTIEKGEPWGEPGSPGPETVSFGSDSALAGAAAAAWERGRHLEASLSSGDILVSLGIVAPRPSDVQHRYPFDLGFVSLDGGPPRPFAAHVRANRRRWAGDFAVVMNVGWIGSWYLGPRAHPNDGLLDVTTGRLDPRQRLLARTRARTGTHLPHPNLKMVRQPRWEGVFERPVVVTADGETAGSASSIAVWVEPDCFTVIV